MSLMFGCSKVVENMPKKKPDSDSSISQRLQRLLSYDGAVLLI